MLEPVKSPATYQDILDANRDQRAELLDGKLYLQPAPRPDHQLVVRSLSAQLPITRQGWVILPGVDVRFSPTTILCPDLSGWRAARFVNDAARQELLVTNPIESIPDWVCEVLSPKTRGYDRKLKGEKYLAAGVQWRWIVDPREKYLEIYEAGDGRWQLTAEAMEDDEVELAPFMGLGTLDLALLWNL